MSHNEGDVVNTRGSSRPEEAELMGTNDAERGDGKTPATRDEPNSPKADSSKV